MPAADPGPVPRWHPEHPAHSDPAVRAFLDAAEADRAEWHAHLGDMLLTAFYAVFLSAVVALIALGVAAALTGHTAHVPPPTPGPAWTGVGR